MKRILGIFLVMTLLLTGTGAFPAAAEAGEVVQVELDGQLLSFLDQQPVIVNGRTLIPIRGIFEAVGAEVTWHSTEQTVVIEREDIHLSLTVGEAKMLCDGTEVPLEVPAVLMNDRTMIPLRAVMETLNLHIGWEPVTRTVVVITPEKDKAWEYIHSTGKIAIGVTNDYPPMNFSDDTSGELAGFDIDFANLLADKLGLQCVVVPINWSEKFDMLSAGMVDVIISGFSVEDDRIEEAMFSIPYLKSNEAVMTKKSLGIESMADLAEQKIGVQEGFAAEKSLEKLTNGEIIKFDSHLTARSNLDAGEIKAMVVDDVYAKYYQSLDPDYEEIYQFDRPEYFAVGMNIEALSLCGEINDAIEEIKSEPALDALLLKWFGSTENKVA